MIKPISSYNEITDTGNNNNLGLFYYAEKNQCIIDTESDEGTKRVSLNKNSVKELIGYLKQIYEVMD
jgi:hypothetical protein